MTLSRGAWDIEVPGPILALAGLLSIVAFSIVGCFAYYPSPAETLEELKLAETETLSAARAGQKEHALHWLPICEGWIRRLQVGTYLRHGRLSEYHRMKARVVSDKLEALEHLVENGDSPDDISKQVSELSRACGRLSRAFREEL